MDASPRSAAAESLVDACSELVVVPPPEESSCDCGLTTYRADLQVPLSGPALRVGEVWHMQYGASSSFARKTLSLHANGLCLATASAQKGEEECLCSLPLSPFALVQACRFHSIKADSALTWMRLFKVSMFQHGLTHFFATCGNQADTERTRWVADISRVIRAITLSLFPQIPLQTEPIPGAPWTATRLLASYALLCSMGAVSLVYCELHAHWDAHARFVVYADERCSAALLRLTVTMGTVVSERVGVDCSCFSIDTHNFAVRTCALKKMWLRAISNVKVKMRHCPTNPSREDLRHFRAAILEHALRLDQCDESASSTPAAMLPIRKPTEPHMCALCSPFLIPGGADAAAGGALARAAGGASGGADGSGPDAAAGGSLPVLGEAKAWPPDLFSRGLGREPVMSLPSVGSMAAAGPWPLPAARSDAGWKADAEAPAQWPLLTARGEVGWRGEAEAAEAQPSTGSRPAVWQELEAHPSAASSQAVAQQLEARPSAASFQAPAQQLEAAVAPVEPRASPRDGQCECRCRTAPRGSASAADARVRWLCPRTEDEEHSGHQHVRSQPVLPVHQDRLVRIYDDLEDTSLASGPGRPLPSKPWPSPFLHGPAPLQSPPALEVRPL